jgi:hypothetical protein
LPVTIPATYAELLSSPLGVNGRFVITLNVRPARPISAQHWFGRPDSTVSYPRKGTPTVVFSVDHINSEESAAAYRRLYDEFAGKGVEFILLARTDGAFGRSTLLSAHAEVDSLRTYYRSELRLPGILAIGETHFDTLPDGRRGRIKGAENLTSAINVVTADGNVWEFGNGLLASRNWEMRMAMFLRNHVIGGTPQQGRFPHRSSATP